MTDEPPDPPIVHQEVPKVGVAEQDRATLVQDSLTAGQIVRVTRIVNDMNPDWLIRLPLLGDLLALPIPDNPTTAAFGSQLRQEAFIALAVELLWTWAKDQPLLLLIEDAHWLDEASLRLTLALSQTIVDVPLLLLLVRRPPTVGEEDKGFLPDLNQILYNHDLRLGELSTQGLETLASNRLQGKPSALVLSLIQAQAQGNPFYAEELVAVLRETGGLYRQADGSWTLSEAMFKALRAANCLVKDNGQWVLTEQVPLAAADLDLPDSIRGIVLSRVDRLPEAHKVTLKTASVIGPLFEFEVLLRSHPNQPGREALLEQVAILKDREFLRSEPTPGLTYMFKHNITQEVTYETLLEVQQRELHQAVGQTLEGLQPKAVERLAYHYRHSGVRDKTLFYLDKAARKTQREYANETALNYYNQALALEERWEWRQGQAQVLHILGRRAEEETALDALAAVAEAPEYDVAYLRGQYYEAIGNYPEANNAIERALRVCRDRGDMVGEVRCLNQLGLIAHRQGNYDRARVWYNQALALFDTENTYPDGGMQAFGRVLNRVGGIRRQRGEFELAKTCYKKALALSKLIGDRQGEAESLSNLGVTAYYQRDFTETLLYHRQALEIRHAIGDRAGEGISLYNLALATYESGDYNQAQTYFSEALTIHRATGNRWEEINIWNGMGNMYQELGELRAAQGCLQRGLALSQEIGDKAGQAYLLSNLGVVLRDQGDLAAAEKLLNDGLDIVQKHDDKYQVSFFLSYLSTVDLQADRFDLAKERAKRALTLRQELGMRLNTTDDLATVAAAYLATGDGIEALNYTEQALAILEECGGEGPEFPQRDYFICYQVLAEVGQQERAQAVLHSAYNLVMTRAQKISEPALRQSFLEKVTTNREIVAEAHRVLGDGQGVGERSLQ